MHACQGLSISFSYSFIMLSNDKSGQIRRITLLGIDFNGNTCSILVLSRITSNRMQHEGATRRNKDSSSMECLFCRFFTHSTYSSLACALINMMSCWLWCCVVQKYRFLSWMQFNHDHHRNGLNRR
mmetsp:Transcript_29245/g.31453  ORF Transcript_29245/g.31453 Transcript_29245/m.31453 type:complete len:126 (+) Transcript_29245:145-522(+)